MVLSLILVTLGAAAIAGDTSGGQVVIVALQGATLLAALAMSGARRLLLGVMGVAVVSALAVVAVSSVTTETGMRAAVAVVTSVLVAATPFAILRRLRHFTRVDRQVVMGALCVYLLVGFFFAQIYRMVAVITGEPIFVQLADPDGVDLLYYSFITMATVGYGDITSSTDTMRMLSVLEALIGQLYLVTVVALVVSNLGRTRTRPPGSDPTEDVPRITQTADPSRTPDPAQEPSA